MTKIKLKLFDYILTTSAILLVTLLSVRIYSGSNDNPILKIDAPGTRYLYPLDKDKELEIEGLIGLTHITIKDGEAFISESPCENKLCILMGGISKSGQWAACMPNRIFISVEGGSNNEEIDVLSY